MQERERWTHTFARLQETINYQATCFPRSTDNPYFHCGHVCENALYVAFDLALGQPN